MFKFIFINPWKTTGKMIALTLSIIGASYTMLEILTVIFPETMWMDFYRDSFAWISLVILIISFITVVWPLRQFTCKIKDYDINVTLKAGRIEKENDSIVISTNSSFVTTMEDEIISPKSAQGAYQMKYYKNSLQKLDTQLKKALKLEPNCAGLILKGKVYPVYNIGTIAKTTQGDRRVYFLALNDINQYGQNTNHDIDTAFNALNGLWQNIIEKGNTESELAIPVIASGRAGIAEATKETMMKAIVDTFISAIQNNSSTITKHLKIIIFPDDIKKINLSDIKEYVKYRCTFAHKDSSNKIGNGIS